MMVSPGPHFQPAPREPDLHRLRRELEELVEMTSGLEDRLRDPEVCGRERRDLEALRMRYAREAVARMMELDELEAEEATDQDF